MAKEPKATHREQPHVHFILSDSSAAVYVDEALFDQNDTIGKLDIIGLLKRVGCTVTKEQVESSRRRTIKAPAGASSLTAAEVRAAVQAVPPKAEKRPRRRKSP
jgi:hypothetical protein